MVFAFYLSHIRFSLPPPLTVHISSRGVRQSCHLLMQPIRKLGGCGKIITCDCDCVAVTTQPWWYFSMITVKFKIHLQINQIPLLYQVLSEKTFKSEFHVNGHNERFPSDCLAKCWSLPVKSSDQVSYIIREDDAMLAHVPVVSQYTHRHMGGYFGQFPQDVVKSPAIDTITTQHSSVGGWRKLERSLDQ